MLKASVVIPVRNGANFLGRCLESLSLSSVRPHEILVVDDGSTDGCGAMPQAAGVTVMETGRPAGPAVARNLGAARATGNVLIFLDADVCVSPDTLQKLLARLEADPNLDAVFGSYDTEPASPGLVSQYKNLLQHYVHQHGRIDSQTFWSGCGAIRRGVFRAVGGFNEQYTRPSIEDIDLGYRLIAKGRRIALDPRIQVKHLKKWRLRGLLASDICDRALPWTRLIVSSRRLPDDLNLGIAHRITSVSLLTAVALAISAVFSGTSWLWILPPLGLAVFLNRRFYGFLARKRGPMFLAGAIPLHLLYYLYSLAAFIGGTSYYWLINTQIEEAPARPSKVLAEPRRPDL